MFMDRELRRKRRRIVVTHFELSWNDCKPKKKTYSWDLEGIRTGTHQPWNTLYDAQFAKQLVLKISATLV